MKTIEEIKPSWELLGFDEKTEDVPEKLYECKYRSSYHLKQGGQIVFGCIIGKSVIFRVFDATVSNRGWPDKSRAPWEKLYIDRNSLREAKRYVFTESAFILENRDGNRKRVSVKELKKETERFIDASIRKEGKEREREYERVALCLDRPFKSLMIRGLKRVENELPVLYFSAFVDLYEMVCNNRNLPKKGTVPECILYDLYYRSYSDGEFVKPAKDMALVVSSRKHPFFEDLTEETRVYFDSEKAYYFSKNGLSGNWQSEDLETRIGDEDYYPFDFMCEIIRDETGRDLFDHTYAERFVRGGSSIDSDAKIRFRDVLARMYYPALEQAAKIDREDLYEQVFYEIADHSLDKNKNLTEVYGITIPQMKYLDQKLFTSCKHFREHIKREDFCKAFPDIKKRIFAVCMFIATNHNAGVMNEEYLNLFLEAAPTIYSLERVKKEKRSILVGEYTDYLKMYVRMRTLLEHPEQAGELETDIRAFGEFKVNMKPSRISENHHRLVRLASVVENRPLLMRCSPKIRDRKTREADRFEYATEKYLIRMPGDAEEIVAEGCVLQHCVGSAGYIEAMAEGRTTILFLRKKAKPDVPMLTLEVKNGAIIQCYGFRDRLNEDPEIVGFLNEYAEKRGFGIRACIMREKETG